MADILSQGAQSYEPQADDSPDPLTFPLGLMHRSGAPRLRNAPGSTTSSRQQVDTREYRRRRTALPQEQYKELLAAIIQDGKMEFEAQRVEITNFTDALLAQAKTITEEQAAHKIIYDGAKTTYDELTTLRQQVKDEIAALKGEAAGQKEAVETLTDKIKAALVIQWEALIKKLGEKNDKIIGEAQAEFDQIKADLKSLQDWSGKAIKQEQDDRSKSCENNKESNETLDRTTTTIKRKLKDLDNTTSKRKRGISADIEEEIRRHRTPPPLRDGLGRGLGGTLPAPPPPPSPPPPETRITLG